MKLKAPNDDMLDRDPFWSQFDPSPLTAVTAYSIFVLNDRTHIGRPLLKKHPFPSSAFFITPPGHLEGDERDAYDERQDLLKTGPRLVPGHVPPSEETRKERLKRSRDAEEQKEEDLKVVQEQGLTEMLEAAKAGKGKGRKKMKR